MLSQSDEKWQYLPTKEIQQHPKTRSLWQAEFKLHLLQLMCGSPCCPLSATALSPQNIQYLVVVYGLFARMAKN